MRWKDGTIVIATTYSASSEADCEYPLYVASNIEREEEHMNELYEAIEQKIKASGYPRAISGEEVYNDICDRSTEKRTEPICFCQNLRRMWCLNTTLRSRMKISTSEF